MVAENVYDFATYHRQTSSQDFEIRHAFGIKIVRGRAEVKNFTQQANSGIPVRTTKWPIEEMPLICPLTQKAKG